MRISALLISDPRSITDIIQVLKIKPQYVFIFVSSAFATGLLGVAKRQSDQMIETSAPAKNTEQKKSLFSRILNKLRG